MTKEQLEDRLIELCEEYAEENGLSECCFDFSLSIYPDYINPCFVISDEVEEAE